MRTSFVVVLLALLSVGCGRTVHAHLDSARGLGEGAPVMVSGVQVGEVRELRLVEGQVDLELALDTEHELTLREDTCAIAGRLSDGRAALVVAAGRGAPVSGSASIPQCELGGAELGDAFRELGQGMGVVLRQVSEGFFDGVRHGASPTP